MSGLKNSYQKYMDHDPEGFDHPSLTKGFNDLAKSPIGRNIVRYYREELKAPLYVSNDLPPGVLGETWHSEIIVTPGANAEMLAHEMRHAYQNHAMKLHDRLIYNPFFHHTQTRMIEADAFAFACLNAITRWREMGYRSASEVLLKEPKPTTENEAVYLFAFQTAQNKNFDPEFMPRLMRKTFERYYFMIAAASHPTSYEQRAMDHGVRLYKAIDDTINPPRLRKLTHAGISGLLATTALFSTGFGLWEPAILCLTGLGIKAAFERVNHHSIARITDDFNNTTQLIDGLCEKLGGIPGIEGNYLTNPKDIKLSAPFFTEMISPKHLAIHKEWQDKIQAGIKRRAPANDGPK